MADEDTQQGPVLGIEASAEDLLGMRDTIKAILSDLRDEINTNNSEIAADQTKFLDAGTAAEKQALINRVSQRREINAQILAEQTQFQQQLEGIIKQIPVAQQAAVTAIREPKQVIATQKLEPVSSEWAAASAKLRAQIAQEAISTAEITRERERIIAVVDKEIDALKEKAELTNRERTELQKLTVERERQTAAIAEAAKIPATTPKAEEVTIPVKLEPVISAEWAAASARLRAEISQETLSTAQIATERERIIEVIDKEINALKDKEELTNKERSELQQLTAERERQVDAIAEASKVPPPKKEEAISPEWLSASARLSSDIARQLLDTNQIVEQRQRIIDSLDKEIEALRVKGELSNKERTDLEKMTAERERQTKALAVDTGSQKEIATPTISDDWVTAVAKLRADIAQEVIDTGKIVEARQRIIVALDAEINALKEKDSLTDKERSNLERMTAERERQAKAIVTVAPAKSDGISPEWQTAAAKLRTEIEQELISSQKVANERVRIVELLDTEINSLKAKGELTNKERSDLERMTAERERQTKSLALDAPIISPEWANAVARLRADIAQEVTDTSGVVEERRRILGILDEEINALKSKESLTDKERLDLEKMTAERELQAEAIAESAAKGEVSPEWQTASTKLRADIAQEVIGTKEITEERTRIIQVIDREIGALKAKSELTNKERADLQKMTLERERQTDALRTGAKVGVTAGTREALAGVGGASVNALQETINKALGSGAIGSLGSALIGGLAGGGAVLGIQAIGNAVSGLVGEIRSLVEQGDKLANIENTFNRLSLGIGARPAEFINDLRLATRGLVEDTNLQVSANRILLQGLPITENQIAKLVGSVSSLAQIQGKSVPESLDLVGRALSSGRLSMLAYNLGLDELTKQQLRQAQGLRESIRSIVEYNIIMEGASRQTEKVGGPIENLGTSLARTQTAWENFLSKLGDSIAKSGGARQLAESLEKIATGLDNNKKAIDSIVGVWDTFIAGLATIATLYERIAAASKGGLSVPGLPESKVSGLLPTVTADEIKGAAKFPFWFAAGTADLFLKGGLAPKVTPPQVSTGAMLESQRIGQAAAEIAKPVPSAEDTADELKIFAERAKIKQQAAERDFNDTKAMLDRQAAIFKQAYAIGKTDLQQYLDQQRAIKIVAEQAEEERIRKVAAAQISVIRATAASLPTTGLSEADRKKQNELSETQVRAINDKADNDVAALRQRAAQDLAGLTNEAELKKQAALRIGAQQEADTVRAGLDLQMATLETAYANGLKSTQAYVDDKIDILQQEYEAQVKLQEDLFILGQKGPEERAKLNASLVANAEKLNASVKSVQDAISDQNEDPFDEQKITIADLQAQYGLLIAKSADLGVEQERLAGHTSQTEQQMHALARAVREATRDYTESLRRLAEAGERLKATGLNPGDELNTKSTPAQFSAVQKYNAALEDTKTKEEALIASNKALKESTVGLREAWGELSSVVQGFGVALPGPLVQVVAMIEGMKRLLDFIEKINAQNGLRIPVTGGGGTVGQMGAKGIDASLDWTAGLPGAAPLGGGGGIGNSFKKFFSNVGPVIGFGGTGAGIGGSFGGGLGSIGGLIGGIGAGAVLAPGATTTAIGALTGLSTAAGGTAAAITAALGPIALAIGAVILGIGIVGQKMKKKTAEMAQDIGNSFRKVIDDYTIGNSTLISAIQTAEAQRNAAITALSGKKGGQEQLGTLLPQMDQAIAQLKAKQKQIIDTFNIDLGILRLPKEARDVATQMDDLTKRIKDFTEAGGSAAAAAEFLTRSLEDLKDSIASDLLDSKKQAIQLLLQEIALEKQKAEIIENANKQISDTLNRGVLSRSRSIAQTTALQIAEIKKARDEQIKSIDEQKAQLEAQVAGQKELFGLTSDEVSLKQALLAIEKQISLEQTLQIAIQKEQLANLIAQSNVPGGGIGGVTTTTGPDFQSALNLIKNSNVMGTPENQPWLGSINISEAAAKKVFGTATPELSQLNDQTIQAFNQALADFQLNTNTGGPQRDALYFQLKSLLENPITRVSTETLAPDISHLSNSLTEAIQRLQESILATVSAPSASGVQQLTVGSITVNVDGNTNMNSADMTSAVRRAIDEAYADLQASLVATPDR